MRYIFFHGGKDNLLSSHPNFDAVALMDRSTVNLFNNIISGNSNLQTQSGAGVYISNMIAYLHNNVISNNKHAASKTGNGGGIFLYNSNSIIVNNTIVYNDAENGGGLYCSYGSSPVLINNILYGNTSSLAAQLYIADNNSAPKLLYNLNQSNSWGCAEGVNYNWEANYDYTNFDENPQFVNYALQNYKLKEISPCINAGIEGVDGLNLPNADLAGNLRIYDEKIDIGAYEYGAPKVETSIENISAKQALVIYPNPSGDGIFHLNSKNITSWTVYDMSGKQILKGNNTQVDLSSHNKGIYLIKILAGTNVISSKLIKM